MMIFLGITVAESRVTLSPADVVSVCPGERLAFTCSTEKHFLNWTVTILRSSQYESRSRLIPADSTTDIQPVIVFMTQFDIERINSSNGALAIVSVLSVPAINVMSDLNGTEIRCTDIGNTATDTSTSVSTVHIIEPHIGMQAHINMSMYLFLLPLQTCMYIHTLMQL